MIWNFSKYTDRTAVVDDQGNRLTYGQLDSAGRELCDQIGGRSLVFVMCANVPGSLIGYTGLLNGSIVPVMLREDMDRELLAGLYEEYRPACIWAPAASVSKYSFEGCRPVYASHGYELLRTPFPKGKDIFPDLALLLTTSGSTGSPKFVRQSYENIRANTDSIVEYLHLDQNERAITTLPMNYTYGISIINSHLAAGAQILLTDHSLMEKDFWKFFKENGATSFGGVPYTYEILKRLRMFRMELPSLHTMTQAGGKLLPELHREFAEYAENTGREFVVMYGQCEATARMGYLPPSKALEKCGSMGIAIPGGRFELIDADGHLIEDADTTGELVYYGKNVTMGYAQCEADLRLGDERHGRLQTGDMARRDQDGFYYIVGRKKRFLKIYGNRVNLDETERMLKNAFPSDEIACGGIDDRLYIFAADDTHLMDMKSFLSKKTGLNGAAFYTVKVSAIPHNEAGKTLYKELEKYYV